MMACTFASASASFASQWRAERGAPFVVGDGLGEAALAAFQRLHDLLQFRQRVLEGLAREILSAASPMRVPLSELPS